MKSITIIMQTTPKLVLLPREYSPIDSLCKCIEHLNDWMCLNVLQLNTGTTEITLFGAKSERLRVNINHCSLSLKTKKQVRNLNVKL